MARYSAFWLAVLAAFCAISCNGSHATRTAVASTLTKEVTFTPPGMLINDPLPATTDPRATLLPLGPTLVVEPGTGSIMALEVDDPAQRDVAATLVQFEDEGSHMEIPTGKGQKGDVVENSFKVSKAVCKGLCDALFVIHATEKVKLADGKISSGAQRDVVVDCRKAGDPAACTSSHGSDGGTGSQGSPLLCGDPTKGQIALTGDRAIDAHIDAIRQLSKVTGNVASEVKSALSAVATSLGVDRNGSAADITDALRMRIDQQSEAGLTLLLGERGCAVRLEQVSLALRVCDPDGVASLPTLQCGGVCEPDPAAASVCAGAAMGGCRGLPTGQQCGGRCSGVCEVALPVAAHCDGTCMGHCDTTCADDGVGGCAGPCDGMCTGKCRQLSSAMCDGDCTGLCDEPKSGTPSCGTPLVPYCSPAMDATLACPGDCFGTAAVDKGSTLCRPSAVAIARAYPRCEAALVQLSFAHKAGTTSADQTAFSMLVLQLDAPLVRLYDALARIGLLSAASADLSAAAKPAIADELTTGLAGDPKDKGLLCAGQRLPDAATWLETEQTTLMGLKADAMQVLSAVNVM